MLDKLFNYMTPLEEQRVPIRPLGQLSDFVVDQMPTMLEQIREGTWNVEVLVSRSITLLASLQQARIEEIKSNPQETDIAALDLKMIENAIAFSSGVVPTELAVLTDELSLKSGQVPGLTYEDLVMLNPINDRRTFTTGMIGISEHDFYETHRQIEGMMDVVIERMWAAINSLTNDTTTIENLLPTLGQIKIDLEKVVPYVKVFRRMEKQHFSVFRQYLSSLPHRQFNGEPLKGASGAFSATVPLVDLLLAGENIQGDHMAYLHVNMNYFPRKGQEQLETAFHVVHEERTLNAFYNRQGQPATVKPLLQAVSEVLHLFRGAHYEIVNRQLPEAITGQVAGTAGENDVPGFLLRRVRTKHIES